MPDSPPVTIDLLAKHVLDMRQRTLNEAQHAAIPQGDADQLAASARDQFNKLGVDLTDPQAQAAIIALQAMAMDTMYVNAPEQCPPANPLGPYAAHIFINVIQSAALLAAERRVGTVAQ